MSKPTILVCTDYAGLDTGFARVAREICTGLQLTGKYKIVQFAWFHNPSDKLIPFKVIPTDRTSRHLIEADKYGALSYDGVVANVRPDLVFCIGDEWMISHYGQRPRDFPMAVYVPIDGEPMMPRWFETFKTFDQLVLYGEYGEKVVRQIAGKNFPIVKIPHGVNINTFKPLSAAEKLDCRKMICDDPDRFIVGCVARNNVRKQLPRLLKAFRRFVNPWTSCTKCGMVIDECMVTCPNCGAEGEILNHGPQKSNALLYLHAVSNDPAGHPLIELIQRHKLNGFVGIPENMQVGRGVTDEHLNQFYNGFDVFTLPTSGEGWGLPILEAMSAGLPVLVTDYSAHVEFVHGAGEFINVAEWDTCAANNMERALVDLHDYVMKLDRFYYEPEEFIRKWGKYMTTNGYPEENLSTLDTGKKLREGMGLQARERALKYDWPPIVQQWDDLFTAMLQGRRIPEVDAKLNLEVL